MYRVHNAAPELGRALAAHFNKLNPPPAGGAPAGLAEKGKKIFEGGDSDNNIPACIVCHGPQGQGAGKNPSLAGQRYPYVVNELRNWRTKRDQRYETETAATMAPIAASLSKAETEAVAAYVNSIWLRHGRYEAEAKSQPSCFPWQLAGLKRLSSSAKGFSLETAPCATGLQPRDLPPRHGLLDSSLPILKASFRAFTIAGATTPYLSSICGGQRGRSCQGRRRNWLPFYQAWHLSLRWGRAARRGGKEALLRRKP